MQTVQYSSERSELQFFPWMALARLGVGTGILVQLARLVDGDEKGRQFVVRWRYKL